MTGKPPPLTFSRPIGESYKDYAQRMEGVVRGLEHDRAVVTDAVRSLLLTLCPGVSRVGRGAATAPADRTVS